VNENLGGFSQNHKNPNYFSVSDFITGKLREFSTLEPEGMSPSNSLIPKCQ